TSGLFTDVLRLLGLRHVIAVINKIDLGGFDRARWVAAHRRSAACARGRARRDRAPPDRLAAQSAPRRWGRPCGAPGGCEARPLRQSRAPVPPRLPPRADRRSAWESIRIRRR